LLPKTLLTVGQKGGTNREGVGPEMVPDFDISDQKLCAYNKATRKVVDEVRLQRNATGAPVTDKIEIERRFPASGCSKLRPFSVPLRISYYDRIYSDCSSGGPIIRRAHRKLGIYKVSEGQPSGAPEDCINHLSVYK
jgi:hypothetical protein